MQQYPSQDPLDERPRPRQRRADRYRAQEPSPLQRAASPLPPEEETRPAPRIRRALPAAPAVPRTEKRREKREIPRLSLPRALVLALLTCVCVLCAYQFALNCLRISDWKAEQARIAREYQQTVDRHQPRYTSSIVSYAGKYAIEPAYVAAIIYRESHYDPTAESSAGARGLMQLMPDTGTWMAEKAGLTGYTADSLYDPEINIWLGTRYLNYLSGIFDGDPILVACGYHAGANNVKAWIRNYSSDGVTLTLDEIPMEDSRTYARRVMESYAIYLQHYFPSDPAPAGSARAVSDPGAV